MSRRGFLFLTRSSSYSALRSCVTTYLNFLPPPIFIAYFCLYASSAHSYVDCSLGENAAFTLKGLPFFIALLDFRRIAALFSLSLALLVYLSFVSANGRHSPSEMHFHFSTSDAAELCIILNRKIDCVTQWNDRQEQQQQ